MARPPSKTITPLDQEWQDEENHEETAKGRSHAPHQDRFHEKRGTQETKYRKPSKKKIRDFLERPNIEEHSEISSLLESIPSISSEYGHLFAHEAVRHVESLARIREFDSRYYRDEHNFGDYVLDLDLLRIQDEENIDLAQMMPEIMGLRHQKNAVVEAGLDIIVGSATSSTTDMEHDYDNFMASKKAYDLIQKGVQNTESHEKIFEMIGVTPEKRELISPLLKILSSPDIGKAVRAETFTRFYLYISNGWAEFDLNEHNNDPKSIPVKNLVQEMRAGNKVSIAKLAKVFQDRFNDEDMFIHGIVENRGGKYKVKPAKPNGSNLFSMIKGTFQGSGVVDALIRDKENPSEITVAVITSDKDFTKSRDQLARHAIGIQNSIKEKTPPFKDGDYLASVQIHSTALMPENGRSSLREEIKAAYVAAGKSWDNRKDCDFFNLLPLFSLLSASSARGLNSSVVLNTRHKRYGAGNTPFEQREELEQVREVTDFFTSNLLKLGEAAPYIRLSWENPKSRSAFIQTFTMLMESVDGLHQRYGSIQQDDPQATPQEKETAEYVRKSLETIYPQIIKIVEMGAAQNNQLEFVNIGCRILSRQDPKWITQYNAHVVDRDEDGQQILVYSTSRQRAQELWNKEEKIRDLQQQIWSHLDTHAENKNLTEGTKANMAAVRKAFGLAAVKSVVNNEPDVIPTLMKINVGKKISFQHNEAIVSSTGKIIPLIEASGQEILEIARDITNVRNTGKDLIKKLSEKRKSKTLQIKERTSRIKK